MHVSNVKSSLLYALLHVEVLPADPADAGQSWVVSYIYSVDYLLHVHIYSESFYSGNF